MAMFATKPDYTACHAYLTSVKDDAPTTWNFKQNPVFNQFMEHVNREQGIQYIQCIERQFPEVTFDALRLFVQMNDRYGAPTKSIMPFYCVSAGTNKLLYCSPTSLRYAYQALLTLKHAMATGCTHIMELGAGYGGMFLALVMMVSEVYPECGLRHVTMLEAPGALPFLTAYLAAHETELVSLARFTWSGGSVEHMADHVVWEEDHGPTMLVSHYGFTEMNYDAQSFVRRIVVPKCTHGLLTWQTCFGDGVDDAQELLGTHVTYVDEEPATGPAHAKNYYVFYTCDHLCRNETDP